MICYQEVAQLALHAHNLTVLVLCCHANRSRTTNPVVASFVPLQLSHGGNNGPNEQMVLNYYAAS